MSLEIFFAAQISLYDNLLLCEKLISVQADDNNVILFQSNAFNGFSYKIYN